jgi:hypothetical protein
MHVYKAATNIGNIEREHLLQCAQKQPRALVISDMKPQKWQRSTLVMDKGRIIRFRSLHVFSPNRDHKHSQEYIDRKTLLEKMEQRTI